MTINYYFTTHEIQQNIYLKNIIVFNVSMDSRKLCEARSYFV